jgi:hypothetical protein
VPTGEIEVTCAPSWTPLTALIETVAAWPTLMLLMSDSLNETVIVSVFELMISAKPVDELELDSVAPVAALAVSVELAELEELLEELLDTEAPTVAPLSEATVPVAGA